jgi:hypothetical protein
LLDDGFTGVEAVNEILKTLQVPVLFNTGHPEALLTGRKPEPTFVIGKPYAAETVRVMIGQMLSLEKALGQLGPLWVAPGHLSAGRS